MSAAADRLVVAIDAGTTGIRSRVLGPGGFRGPSAYREFTQHFPEPGRVEHEAIEIWEAARDTLNEVIGAVGADRIAAIGLTNQRETVVAWDRTTGIPHGPAIVWQDRRTAARCEQLRGDGHEPMIRRLTGLVLDPYFSASKIEWMLANGVTVGPDLAVGTIDTWLIWNLTGGERYVTDPSNASRTMLFDINARRWSPELAELFGVPIEALAEVVPSSGVVGNTSARCGVAAGIPIAGIAGDQQAALFGQACVQPGMAKNTYGTGSFVLLNIGSTCPPPVDGMLTTVAWTLADGTTHYALEGAIFVTGAAVQWLRDGLQLIESAADVAELAQSVDDNGGVYVVPAFTGLGTPWWDPHARGTIVGITRGTTAGHLARAVVEAMAFQTRDAIEAMVAASGTPITDLRVDGGASAVDAMLQLQADQIGATVRRPNDLETTALGAAYLAGLAVGVWPDLAAIASEWTEDAVFEPRDTGGAADATHALWRRAVERSRQWEQS